MKNPHVYKDIFKHMIKRENTADTKCKNIIKKAKEGDTKSHVMLANNYAYALHGSIFAISEQKATLYYKKAIKNVNKGAAVFLELFEIINNLKCIFRKKHNISEFNCMKMLHVNILLRSLMLKLLED